MSTTTVAQLIEALQKFPPHAEIECGFESEHGGDTYLEFGPVDTEYFTVLDYSSEEDRAKYPTMNGRIIVKLFAK